jgi:hypothetical protein
MRRSIESAPDLRCYLRKSGQDLQRRLFPLVTLDGAFPLKFLFAAFYVLCSDLPAQLLVAATPGQFKANCQSAQVGESTFSEGRHIEYVRGNSDLILAAPHGGRLTPAGFPVRNRAGDVTVVDENTDQLARELWQEIAASKQMPHLIICHLKRTMVDANRPLEAACDESSSARVVWQDYQDAVEVAKQVVQSDHRRGLFIELHGHGHPTQRLEIGYLLRARDYELPTAEFLKLGTKTSLREIVERGQVNVDELLRGSQSLGLFMSQQGIAAVPSPEFPKPGKQPYFNGGWNILTHGSRDSGTISSLQIECHRQGIRDSTAAITASSKRMAAAIREFMAVHYRTVP